MSHFKTKTLFSYNDLYSVKTPDTNVTCESIKCDPNSCNNNNKIDCTNCYKKEYCTNIDYANELYKNNAKHLGKTQEIVDISQIYNSEYIKSLNLMVGIIGILSFIFYNK